DGKYLFPRGWRRIKYSKRGGLYLTDTAILSDLKRFEALCFAMALKRLYRAKARAERGSAKPTLSLRYVSEVLRLKERRCKQLRASAQRYGFMSIKRTYSVLGKRKDLPSLRKNIHGPPVFGRGNYA